MRIAAKGMPTRHYTNCIYPAGNKQLLKIPDFLKFIVHLVKTLLPTYDAFFTGSVCLSVHNSKMRPYQEDLRKGVKKLSLFLCVT